MRKLLRQAFLLSFFAVGLAASASGGTILFLGDSLTAGLGVKQEQAYPALIEEKIREKKLPFDVINAGVSGDTTAGGLARLDWVLQKRIDVLVLALGANDAALVPFLLEGVGGHDDLNQVDHIHPTAAGHKILAENVWRVLEPLLTKN